MEEMYDTFLVERVINCGKQDHGYSLARCVERYLGKTLDKETRNKFIGLKGQPYTVDQITYGANDVVYLLDIREKQLGLLHTYELQQVARLENKVVKVFSEIEYEGLMIDKDRWTAMAEENVKLAYEQELKLDDIVLEHPLLQHYRVPVQVDMFASMDEVRKTHIKWSSPLQILELFQNLVPGLEDVNGKKLNKYRYKHKLIDEYIRYKERTKLANAYGTKFFNYVNSDGKVHTNFSQILDTGRVSSSKPNMQQIPSDNTFRNCFITEPGWVFVSSDYSSQELNVLHMEVKTLCGWKPLKKDWIYMEYVPTLSSKISGEVRTLMLKRSYAHRLRRLISDSPTAWDRSNWQILYRYLKQKRRIL